MSSPRSRPALQFYRRRKDVAVDMEEMDTETRQGEQKGQDEDFTVRQFLASKDLYRPLAVACALQVIQQFSGINAVSGMRSSRYLELIPPY